LRDIGHHAARASLKLHGGSVGQAANSIVHARVPMQAEPRTSAPPRLVAVAPRSEITFELHQDLAAAERDWRKLEAAAELSPFQTFAWLSAWQRHMGAPSGIMPAIVVAKRGDEILFLLPLAVTSGGLTRRLTFLGQELCDYNAPLLARDFTSTVGHEFAALWRQIHQLIQATPALRHDTIAFAKMPERVGAQPNPLLCLDVRLNPSGAYETVLGADWEQFYTSKRSSATRRRDRTKLKRLGEMGEVRFVDPQEDTDIASTLDTLIAQKSKQLVRMGVADLFARPGYVEFLRELSSAPAGQRLVHVSRLDVGATRAAVNLGLIHRGCYYHVLASYDDGEVSRFGPGAAHLRELLKFAIARGLQRFDFTIGDEPYKRDWCESEQRLHDYSAAVTVRGWPSAAVSGSLRRIKRAIKHSAPLWNAVVKVRTTIAAMRKKPEPVKELAE
jgi:CelD/BcsL family acetyltransferase involved in cellulose biosynthesis